MDKYEITAELESLIGERLNQLGLELVELSCRYEGADLALRILVDRPEGGINLGECASLNQEINAILEGKNILPQGCLLEVSSPGIDRPLKNERDFRRCLNRNARFFLSEQLNGKLEWLGKITNVTSGSVFIDTGKAELEIPLDKINKAKQEI